MTALISRRCLVALPLLLLLAPTFASAEESSQEKITWILSTKKMCCSKESKPAIAELSKIPGIAKVVPNHRKRTLTITPSDEELPSARAIWEAAERVKLQPVKLTTSEGVFKSKPKR